MTFLLLCLRLTLCYIELFIFALWEPFSCVETNTDNMYVTSFFRISYWSNSEYRTQKCIQSENIHSIILDVHVKRPSTQNFPFNSLQYKLDNIIALSPPLLLKLTRKNYCDKTFLSLPDFYLGKQHRVKSEYQIKIGSLSTT